MDLFLDPGPSDRIVILAPGAGSHKDHPTLLWLSEVVHLCGWRVARFNFRYRTEGRSIPDRMPSLIETYREALAAVRLELPDAHVVCGGHSMGGRVASMMLSETTVAEGLLLFGYPLHPPDKPDQLRDAHLSAIQVPVLQINGTADPFCERPRMEAVHTRLDASRHTMHWIEGADHSYGVKRASGRTKANVAEEIQATLAEWLNDLVSPSNQ